MAFSLFLGERLDGWSGSSYRQGISSAGKRQVKASEHIHHFHQSITVIGPGHRRSAFPSGHTATVFLFFGIWALSAKKRWLSLFLLLPALLVGISRIAVGVHWPADILAGSALGWVSAWLGLRWAQRTPWGMGRRGQTVLGVLLLISAMVHLIIDHTVYPGVVGFKGVFGGFVLGWGGW